MRGPALAATLLLSACASAPPPQERSGPRGKLMIVGGGKIPEEVVRRALDAAGFDEARVLIIPSASGVPEESAASAREMFARAGAKNIDVLEVPDASSAALVKVRAATLIFFGGGDQNRLTAALLNTPLLEEMMRRYREGAVLMGTSAGAAIMGDVMMTGKGDFETIMPDAAETAPGLGFLPGTLVDQHFARRHRHYRLMSALLKNRHLFGIGIDESTAIWVAHDKFEVMGDHTVEFYDPHPGDRIVTMKLTVLTRGMSRDGSR